MSCWNSEARILETEEPQAEPKEEDLAGFEIYWEAELPEAGIKVFEDTDSRSASSNN